MDLQTQDIVIVEGEKMDIKIPYRAIPKPLMVWKKGDTELKTEDRLTLTCELNRVHLELLKCKHEDAGVYTVTLENSLGSKTGTINVKVIGKKLYSYTDSICHTYKAYCSKIPQCLIFSIKRPAWTM